LDELPPPKDDYLCTTSSKEERVASAWREITQIGYKIVENGEDRVRLSPQEEIAYRTLERETVVQEDANTEQYMRWLVATTYVEMKRKAQRQKQQQQQQQLQEQRQEERQDGDETEGGRGAMEDGGQEHHDHGEGEGEVEGPKGSPSDS